MLGPVKCVCPTAWVLQVLRKMRAEETRQEFSAHPLPQDWVGFTPLGVPHMSGIHTVVSPTPSSTHTDSAAAFQRSRVITSEKQQMMMMREEVDEVEKKKCNCVGTAETMGSISGFVSDSLQVAALALVVVIAVGACLVLGANRQIWS